MTTVSYLITGGNYAQAGSASSGVKDMLKRVGAEPQAIRRTMIAAYEAEMNVVIHAHAGHMSVALEGDTVDIEVADDGPGIADIDRAMTEGFSTAPAEARALGFGAGMGLPNIRRHTDHFAIQSVVGRGTRLRFSIRFAPAPGRPETEALSPGPAHGVSLRTIGGLCQACLRCLTACPTQALRLRGRPEGRFHPTLLDGLCIGCTACIAACPTGALTMASAPGVRTLGDHTTLVVPAAFLTQFGPGVSPHDVEIALGELGYSQIVTTPAGEGAGLRDAVVAHARAAATPVPVLSPVCPAVLDLIELRFPSLLDHVAPFLTPIEALQAAMADRDAIFVAACPAQRSALVAAQQGAGENVIEPTALRQAVHTRLREHRTLGARPSAAAAPPPAAPEPASDGVLEVSGLAHVMRVLEDIENGRLPDVAVAELYACDQGCFGSPLFGADPFVARRRWRAWAGECAEFQAVRRTVPLRPRPGLRLDADMARAIAKLAEIDALTKSLPGRHCAMCGAPTCRALAEDVVLGRADLSACVHLADSEGATECS